jgi:hypothetical protein
MVVALLLAATQAGPDLFGTTASHPKLSNGTKPNVVIFFADVSRRCGVGTTQ